MNLLDADLFGRLYHLVGELERDSATNVVVFAGADPEYFLAHYDIEDLLGRTAPGSWWRGQTVPPTARTLPGAAAGHDRQDRRPGTGRGSEFALELDTRFAAAGTAVLSQFEVAVGLLPGGGGTQNLPPLVGRGRVLEIILGGEDVDA